MANWETQTSSSTFDAKIHTTNMTANRDGGRSASSAGGGLSFGNKDAVGINIGQVENMRAKIREWVTGIQNEIGNIDPTADASNAYKSDDGAVEDAVKNYVENVKTYCQNLTSQLLAFSDKLEDVKNKWIENTGNLAGVITSDAQLNDSGSAYTEQL